MGGKLPRAGGKIPRGILPPGGQAAQEGKINCYTGICHFFFLFIYLVIKTTLYFII